MKRKQAAEQQCPICGAAYPLEASRCAECGAALRGVPVPVLPPASSDDVSPRREAVRAKKSSEIALPEWALGDADLDEGLLPRAPVRGLFIGCALLAVILVLALFLISRQGTAVTMGAETGTPTADSTPPAVGMSDTALPGFDTLTPVMPPPTNTRIMVMPTMAFDTVTPMLPTLTPTPTRGPCIQVAEQNDTLYGLASRCGYYDMTIIPEILRINNMESAAELQIGQSVEIPWPDQVADGGSAEGTSGDATVDPVLATSDPMSLEPTLPPGVTWYTVKIGDTALSIVLELDINMRILRDLNPELSFDTCDFGQVGGGPSCNVMVYEGQQVRVPAPTPTATVPPTLTGSETPEPTPTPTYNAPFSVSPSDNMLFEAFELPTLRWVASGVLRQDEVYLLTVDDRTGGVLYYVTTRDLSFQAPADWQPTDGRRHVFAWNVAVARLQPGSNTAAPTAFKTETRTFTWESR